MKTTVNERVKLISERFCNGNISELARIVGLNQSALRDVVGAKQVKPGFEIIFRIVDNAVLNINAEWLVTGDGDVQKTNATKVDKGMDINVLLDRIQVLAVKIHELESIINELKTPKYRRYRDSTDIAADPGENVT